MRAKEFLRLIIEKAEKTAGIPGDPSTDPLYSLKATIAHKIKDLPDTPEVKDQLEDIEDALKHLDTGKKRRTSAEDELGTWKDEDVQTAKSMLARYIVSMNSPFHAKMEMLKLWKESGLINVGIITHPNGMVGIDKVVKRYSKNPAIQEMANDLLKIDSMGVGKGEFMLRVMSPKITKPSKGDLEIIGLGNLEVKTNNENAARFADRNVRPTSEYQNKASAFVKKYGRYWIAREPQQEVEPQQQPIQQQKIQPQNTQQSVPQQGPLEPIQPQGSMAEATTRKKTKPPINEKPFAKAGINLGQITGLYEKIPQNLKKEYLEDLKDIIENIFPQKQELAPHIVAAVASGNVGQALQYWSRASVLNYMANKDNIGVLFIDLKASPVTFTFFDSVENLTAAGLRLHARSTAYVISTDYQNLYPPVNIQTTTQVQDNHA
jgi:hypothetical protein